MIKTKLTKQVLENLRFGKIRKLLWIVPYQYKDFDINYTLYFDELNYKVIIENVNGTLFDGIIKTKEELLTLLKQLEFKL